MRASLCLNFQVRTLGKLKPTPGTSGIGETKAHSWHLWRCPITSPACGAPSGMLGVVPGPGSLGKGAGSPELSSGGNRELEHALAEACRLLNSAGKMHT